MNRLLASQTTISHKGAAKELGAILRLVGVRKALLVCGNSFNQLTISSSIENCHIPYIKFSGYSPNPSYDQVCCGVEAFHKFGCDGIIAVGGGSAIDTAKCIKLFCTLDRNKNYLTQNFSRNNFPLVALPTTAGSGSEATSFAALYVNGIKKSVEHVSMRPIYTILDPAALDTLPLYQRKCTVWDAFCQAIESWWSVHSTPESIGYSRAALKLILGKARYYIEGENYWNSDIQLAANLAGKAINITKTTAAHAMCYKLSTLYGLPHGHAVALCFPVVWRHMLSSLQNCCDPRGEKYLRTTFEDIANCIHCTSAYEATTYIDEALKKQGILPPTRISYDDVKELAASVDAQRLKNNPVAFNENDFCSIYSKILNLEVKGDET